MHIYGLLKGFESEEVNTCRLGHWAIQNIHGNSPMKLSCCVMELTFQGLARSMEYDDDDISAWLEDNTQPKDSNDSIAPRLDYGMSRG